MATTKDDDGRVKIERKAHSVSAHLIDVPLPLSITKYPRAGTCEWTRSGILPAPGILTPSVQAFKRRGSPTVVMQRRKPRASIEHPHTGMPSVKGLIKRILCRVLGLLYRKHIRNVLQTFRVHEDGLLNVDEKVQIRPQNFSQLLPLCVVSSQTVQAVLPVIGVLPEPQDSSLHR